MKLSLDNNVLAEKSEYTHVGIVKRVRDGTPLKWIINNIGRCRRAFYSTLGTSLYKTQLSPISLAKVYTSVCISRLLYGADIRSFTDNEIEMYQQFHRGMAKDIRDCLVTHQTQFHSLPLAGMASSTTLISQN